MKPTLNSSIYWELVAPELILITIILLIGTISYLKF